MGPSLGTSLGRSSPVAEPSPPRPAPHLLHTCLAAVLSSAGPGPQTVCYMILVQWRAVGTVGHSDGGSSEGPIKSLRRITVGHLLGTVADELWEILAHAASVSRWFHTQGRLGVL